MSVESSLLEMKIIKLNLRKTFSVLHPNEKEFPHQRTQLGEKR